MVVVVVVEGLWVILVVNFTGVVVIKIAGFIVVVVITNVEFSIGLLLMLMALPTFDFMVLQIFSSSFPISNSELSLQQTFGLGHGLVFGGHNFEKSGI
jgi:hypothetical protein